MRNGIIGFLFILYCAVSHVYGQDENWKKEREGEIEEASFVVEKERRIELPIESRKFEKIPPPPVDEAVKNVRPYSFKTVEPDYSPLDIPVRILKIKDEPLKKLYGGSFDAGFGNYMTPYLGVDLFNKREENYLIGFSGSHLSSRNGPVDKENSGNGRTRAELNGRLFRDKVTTGLAALYDRSFYHFYGYPTGMEVAEDSIRRIFNHYRIGASLSGNNDEDVFNYHFKGSFSHINDNLSTNESIGEFDLGIDSDLSEEMDFILESKIFISTYNYSLAQNRNLIKVFPYVIYQSGEFDLTAGLNFVFQDDTLSSRGDVILYPVIRVDYLLGDYFNMYLKLDGDLENVSFHSLTRENPFMTPGVPLVHSNKKIGLEWGLHANVLNYLNIMAGVSLSEYDDLYFYQNDSLNISVFNIRYDHEGTSKTNLFGEIVFSRIEDYHISLRADYYSYSLNQLEEAWHRPTYKISSNLNYNLYDKIIFGADMYVIGGIKARDWILDQNITLDPIIDLNFDISYRFSERLGAFIDFNNILGNNYQRYWRYPARSIQILGGVSLNF